MKLAITGFKVEIETNDDFISDFMDHLDDLKIVPKRYSIQSDNDEESENAIEVDFNNKEDCDFAVTTLSEAGYKGIMVEGKQETFDQNREGIQKSMFYKQNLFGSPKLLKSEGLRVLMENCQRMTTFNEREYDEVIDQLQRSFHME